jgi:phosphate-selective porin OprO and OprP
VRSIIRLCGPSFPAVAVCIAASLATTARAQAPTDPPPGAPTPPVPSPTPPAPSREAQLEERLRRMEEVNSRLLRQYEALSKKYDDLSSRVESQKAPAAAPAASRREGQRPQSTLDRIAESGLDVKSARGSEGTGGRTRPGTAGAEGGEGGAGGGGTPRSARGTAGLGAEGGEGRASTREVDARPIKRPAKVEFSEGLVFSSEDNEFTLTFHDLTQVEYRDFSQANPNSILKDQFFVPRQRWYFTGRATKNIQYYTVINRGYGSLDLLDAFITFNIGGYLREAQTPEETPEEAGEGAQGTGGRVVRPSDQGPDQRIRLRVGRTKAPFLYEYYQIAEGDLIAPERSLFAGNLSPNRRVGAMFLGTIFNDRLDYAAGVFNGPRRSFQDTGNDKDFTAFLDYRPFLQCEGLESLKYFNIGGSFDEGFENTPTQPNAFRTANDQTPSAAVSLLSPTFLTFNNNVIELGNRRMWAGHIAWFNIVRGLNVLAEYGGGFGGYGFNNRNISRSVPFEGYMVQVFYFLTGEQISRRVNVVRPRDRFGYHDGHFGWGAFEVHSRYSYLNIGRDVFTEGFADPNLWTNQAYSIDTGLNWYLNYYTKIYFDWQYSFFGNPVTNGPHAFYRNSNLFWLRFQLFF